MTELLPIIYQYFKLPSPAAGQKLPAAYNEFTKKIDGLTDSNRDGKIDAADKNGSIEPEELYEEIFSHRQKYGDLIKQLYLKGLEDPLEELPEVKAATENLFQKYQPAGQLARVGLIHNYLFSLYDPALPPEWPAVSEHFGLVPSLDLKHPARQQFGSLSPREIMLLPAGSRPYLCEEGVNLLITFLRSAGFPAQSTAEPFSGPCVAHTAVVVPIDGQSVRLEVLPSKDRRLLEKYSGAICSDRQIIAAHYVNDTMCQLAAGNIKAAHLSAETAREIDPGNYLVWAVQGLLLSLDPAETVTALASFEKAIKINPQDAESHYNKGCLLDQLGKTDEAIKSLDQALTLNTNHFGSWFMKAQIFKSQKNMAAALEALDKAIINASPAEKIIPLKIKTVILLDLADAAGGPEKKNLLLGQALAACRQITELDDREFTAWMNRASLEKELGQVRAALDSISRALKLKPDSKAAQDEKNEIQKILPSQKEKTGFWDRVKSWF